MMPDLGKYAEAVLSSYAVSIALIVALVGMSLLRSRRVKAQLDEVERKAQRDG
ncbi:heme exporter protein CcmD [Roseovarius salis]|uniref:heme exporter protein CcmD n=1 Tax=Roseovarius salis TaxID=3376063 RepID=UPI0037C805CB